MVASTWRGDACQQFRLQPVGDVLIADPTNSHRLGHTWRFAHAGDGFYRVADARTGRPFGGRAEWRIEPTEAGTYRLITRDGATSREVLLLTP